MCIFFTSWFIFSEAHFLLILDIHRWDEDAPSWLTATEYLDKNNVAALKVSCVVKNTIRDGGSTAPNTAYTVYAV